MNRLNPEDLHTDFLSGTTMEGPLIPRRYTLTHSDRTGELFLSIGFDYNARALVFGRAGWRETIFRNELPLVLEAIRYGDRGIFQIHPGLDQATIQVHFQSQNPKHSNIEQGGVLYNYK